MSINLYELLGYKTGSSITSALKKANSDLEKLKPYDKLTNQEVVKVLSAIRNTITATKQGLVDELLSKYEGSDSNSDISILESSPKATKSIGNSGEILAKLCENLAKIPLTKDTKYDTISISDVLDSLNIRRDSDMYANAFYRINNILGIDLAYPSSKISTSSKNYKASDDTYFKDKIKIVNHCIMNNKFNSITLEQIIFIMENPYMFRYQDRIYPCNTGAYGVNLFGNDYSHTTIDTFDNYLKKLKKMLTK